MHKPEDIIMVKRKLIDVNELYNDLQGIALEITEIAGPEHSDYDESMKDEPLYVLKINDSVVPFTLYESEIEDYVA